MHHDLYDISRSIISIQSLIWKWEKVGGSYYNGQVSRFKRRLSRLENRKAKLIKEEILKGLTPIQEQIKK